ncbi:hypothetical protein CLV85_0582 [Salinibacterium amurskyense]|uniref:Uncharacterized protein n=1 Tax=Salinibacterium amurskyense TaxID=205941 RepID=A0A2M9D6S7_9MICO|nr:hypothetical protein [Salinibacterium amurskyense]PJJ81406.1 hypothetical protein CLV85_0582 [Salinibacterium amurskyense]GHD80600.1 hypothetical protein GCM10007394_12300 [Salinibacterium amurskyense]
MTDPVPNETPAAAETPDTAESPKKSTITPMRIALWVLVAGAGLFMVLTGLVGVLVKAQ